MQIFVDADACPVVGIVETIAEKYNISTTLLCDTNHVLYSDYSEVIVVGAGADAVDYKLISMPDIPDTMFVLTNDTKVNGAAAILNDDIRQEIAEKVGDFYMLPSSIHETLIIPKDAGMEFKELEQMVQEVNQTQVAPGERLSDHVYEYDAKEHELFRSDRAEERVKQKEEKRDNRHERVSVKEKLAEKKDAVIKMNAGKEHSAPEKKKEAVIGNCETRDARSQT